MKTGRLLLLLTLALILVSTVPAYAANGENSFIDSVGGVATPDTPQSVGEALTLIAQSFTYLFSGDVGMFLAHIVMTAPAVGIFLLIFVLGKYISNITLFRKSENKSYETLFGLGFALIGMFSGGYSAIMGIFGNGLLTIAVVLIFIFAIIILFRKLQTNNAHQGKEFADASGAEFDSRSGKEQSKHDYNNNRMNRKIEAKHAKHHLEKTNKDLTGYETKVGRAKGRMKKGWNELFKDMNKAKKDENKIEKDEKKDLKLDKKIDKLNADMKSLLQQLNNSINSLSESVSRGDSDSEKKHLDEIKNMVNSLKRDDTFFLKAFQNELKYNRDELGKTRSEFVALKKGLQDQINILKDEHDPKVQQEAQKVINEFKQLLYQIRAENNEETQIGQEEKSAEEELLELNNLIDGLSSIIDRVKGMQSASSELPNLQQHVQQLGGKYNEVSRRVSDLKTKKQQLFIGSKRMKELLNRLNLDVKHEKSDEQREEKEN